MNRCLICNKPVYDYVPEFCCNGIECICMGQPIDPCVCSSQCSNALFSHIGIPYDDRRIKENIPLYLDIKNPILYILCAPSGSGKTTKALTLAEPNNIFEADKYWLNCVDDYLFVPSKLGDAHKWCQDSVKFAMAVGQSPLVVSNTNLTKKERQPYINLAKQYNYDYEIVTPDSPWFIDMLPRLIDKSYTEKDVDILCEKNVHNVPRDTIKRMMDKFDLTND